jgi:hypothetical protein
MGDNVAVISKFTYSASIRANVKNYRFYEVF